MYTLIDGEEMNKQHSDTFEIPHKLRILNLKENQYVKLGFQEEGKKTERMWVLITKINDDNFEGTLDNEPFNLETIRHNDTVKFNSKHILSTM